jgi:hypothetical protein
MGQSTRAKPATELFSGEPDAKEQCWWDQEDGPVKSLRSTMPIRGNESQSGQEWTGQQRWEEEDSEAVHRRCCVTPNVRGEAGPTARNPGRRKDDKHNL